jgi:Bacterial regulatory protein, Fis family
MDSKTVASEPRTDGAVTSAEQTGDPSLVAAAHTHLAWVLAHLGDDAARPHAELAWECFSVHQEAAVWVWHAAVTLAWLRATTGHGEGLDDLLAVGIAAWKRAGKPPFEGGVLLFEFDHYPTLLDALESQGLQLEREAGRAIDSANRVAAAAAHGCLARYLRRGPSGRNRHARVALHFARAVALLRQAGATAALASALAAAASHAEFMGETKTAATFREEHKQLRATLAARLDAFPPNDIAPPACAGDVERDWVPLAEVERRYIAEVLRHTHGRITGAGGAATILGLNPSTLSWRIGKLGLRDILAEARLTTRTRSKGKRVKG